MEKEVQDESEITPSQIAILDCLLKNGDTLSLKSYFVDKLPDLKQLKYTIRYINLSFNNFKVQISFNHFKLFFHLYDSK